MEKEKTAGLKAALNEIELAEYADIDKKVFESKEKIEKLQEEWGNYLDDARNSFLKQGIRGTPAVSIFKSDDKAEIRTGYFNLKEIF